MELMFSPPLEWLCQFLQLGNRQMIAACVVVFGGSSADRARSICRVVERRCRKSTVRFIEVDITASLGYDRPAITTLLVLCDLLNIVGQGSLRYSNASGILNL
jgi:hypothetical protein